MGSLEFQKCSRINPSFLDFLPTTCSLLGAWGRLSGKVPALSAPSLNYTRSHQDPAPWVAGLWLLTAFTEGHLLTYELIVLWLSAGHMYPSRVSEAHNIVWELKGGRLWHPGLLFCCCCLVSFEGSLYSCLTSSPLHGSYNMAPASVRWWYQDWRS